jgi:acetyltransferase-like isoleucine patch superfamily enzyme
MTRKDNLAVSQVDFRLTKRLLSLFGNWAKRTYRFQDDTYPDWKYAYFFFYQKILMFNFQIPWPVHYTSYVVNPSRIKFAKKCSPGSGPFQYIQGTNGIVLGNNVQLAPGVQLISANHDPDNYDDSLSGDPLEIGSNVWIGAHAVVLPGVHIGDNVIIGAGSIVTSCIPADSIAVGNPCKVIRGKMPYSGDLL